MEKENSDMVELINPHYEYEVEVPEEGVELQQAIWQDGSDGHIVFCENSTRLSVSVRADYVDRLFHHVFDLIGPAVCFVRFSIWGEARAFPHQPGDEPYPFYEEAMHELCSAYDPTRYFAGYHQGVGLMIDLRFPRELLPAVTACARWMAGGPRPDLSWRDFQPNRIENARD